VGRRTRWDLLIRAIPDPEVGPAEAGWWSELTRGALVLDLNYGPRAAAVRARAAREGRRMEDGLELLLRQGALSFTYWTGVRAPMGAMRAAVANGGA
jgi:shikimate dehydrogenase